MVFVEQGENGMIIVEGPDNSGKSTLIASLVKDLDLLIAERPHGVPGSVNDIISRTSKLLLKQDQKRYILDRHPLFSEPIYGPILRKKNLWEDNPTVHGVLLTILTNSHSEGSVFIIYCRPPDKVVLDLHTHQVKEYDTAEHLEGLKSKSHEIVKAYDKMMSNWADFKYNYCEPGSYELLTQKLRKEYFHERE